MKIITKILHIYNKIEKINREFKLSVGVFEILE